MILTPNMMQAGNFLGLALSCFSTTFLAKKEKFNSLAWISAIAGIVFGLLVIFSFF